jgi:hypothetical protein
MNQTAEGPAWDRSIGGLPSLQALGNKESERRTCMQMQKVTRRAAIMLALKIPVLKIKY